LRAGAGASYYGAFDLSGNVWERAVTVGNPEGRSFLGGIHGDGNLAANGDANQANWPAASAAGSGFNGGGWYVGGSNARISDRYYGGLGDSARFDDCGGRGIRSAGP
jgi:hypothetical protein